MDTETTYIKGDFTDEEIEHRRNIDGLIREPRKGYHLLYAKGIMVINHNSNELLRLEMKNRKLYFFCQEKFLPSAMHIGKQISMNGRDIVVSQHPDTREIMIKFRVKDKEQLLFLLGEELGFKLGWNPKAEMANVYTYCQEHGISEEQLARLESIPSVTTFDMHPEMLVPAPWTQRRMAA